jgi:hypothetical protein
MLLFNFDDKM